MGLKGAEEEEGQHVDRHVLKCSAAWTQLSLCTEGLVQTQMYKFASF